MTPNFFSQLFFSGANCHLKITEENRREIHSAAGDLQAFATDAIETTSLMLQFSFDEELECAPNPCVAQQAAWAIQNLNELNDVMNKIVALTSEKE